MLAGAAFFDQDLNGWDVGRVRFFADMFVEANAFDQDLNGWDVGNAIAMDSMFRGADSFAHDLDGWDVRVNHTTVGRAFEGTPLVGKRAPCWIRGTPCHKFEIEVQPQTMPICTNLSSQALGCHSALEGAATVDPRVMHTAEIAYEVGTTYRLLPRMFTVRDHGKGESTTSVSFRVSATTKRLFLHPETGVILMTFDHEDVENSPLEAVLQVVDRHGRLATLESYTMHVAQRAQFVPKFGPKSEATAYLPLAASSGDEDGYSGCIADASSAATNVTIGASFRLAPPNLLPESEGTTLSAGTLANVNYKWEMVRVAGSSSSAVSSADADLPFSPSLIGMKPNCKCPPSRPTEKGTAAELMRSATMPLSEGAAPADELPLCCQHREEGNQPHSGEVFGQFAPGELGIFRVLITAVDGGGTEKQASCVLLRAVEPPTFTVVTLKRRPHQLLDDTDLYTDYASEETR
jgi:hypothetical protein